MQYEMVVRRYIHTYTLTCMHASYIYTYMFKLGKFYHIFQIKAVGKGVEGAPLMTFCVRPTYVTVESARNVFEKANMYKVKDMWDKVSIFS